MDSRILGWALLIGLAAAAPAAAQEMSVEEIRARLNRQIEAVERNKSPARTLWLNNGQDYNAPLYPDAKPAAPQAAAAEPPLEFASIDFERNSARLSSKALLTLGRIARALDQPEFAQHVVGVIGHTDSLGGDTYNLGLSRRRAASVVAALEAMGVPGNRLQAVGKGSREPKPGLAADDPANRRVELRVLR